jgi:hypothetical protein
LHNTQNENDMRNTWKILAALFIVAAISTSCERAKVRRMVAKETRAKVVWMRHDSCYSVTRPLMSARYKAANATRAWLELANADLMRLNTQMDDRTTDHGGLKVRCYWVGYTVDSQTVDSTVVMIEPTGELVTHTDELRAWFDAMGEYGKIANVVYGNF